MKTKIELSNDDLIKAVKVYLKQHGFNATNIRFDVGMEYRGFGHGEHQVAVLKKVVATVEPIEKSGSNSSLARQIDGVEKSNDGPYS